MKTGNEISLDVVQCTGINSDGSYKMLIASSISPNSYIYRDGRLRC
jgi:hypothetical protein